MLTQDVQPSQTLYLSARRQLLAVASHVRLNATGPWYSSLWLVLISAICILTEEQVGILLVLQIILNNFKLPVFSKPAISDHCPEQRSKITQHQEAMEHCGSGIVSKSERSSQIQDQDGFHPTVRESLAEFTPHDVVNTWRESILTKKKFLNATPSLSAKWRMCSVL